MFARSWSILLSWLVALPLLVLSGCVEPRPAVPGDTDYTVVDLEIEGAHEVSTGPLETGGLSLRPASLTAPPQPYNPYRIEEDRGRIIAFWQNLGFFDITVEGPELDFDHEARTVAVRWRVVEGARYTIGSVDVVDAPEGYRQALLDTVPFEPGDPIDMESYRRHRFAMSDVLLDDGWLHATIFSRTWIDPAAKKVHWVYFVDEGPRTRLGSLQVLGAADVPPQAILERSGLEIGQPLSAGDLRKAELDLMDTGSFHHANIVTNADVPERVRPLPPDTGGILPAERVDAQGNLVPRTLPQDLEVAIVVGEAPSVQVRGGGGAQIDLSRVDAIARGELWLRDVFAPFHHLVFEGRVGYGLLYREDLSKEPLGVYGSALARYVAAGLLGRIGDFRLTAEFDDRLFPGYHTREVMGGPGVRVALTEHLFFDLDLYARYGFAAPGYGAFDPEVASRLELIDGEQSWLDSELRTSLVWDRRNHRVEPTDGWFGGLWLALAPGAPLGDHRYLSSELEARWYVPLGDALSLAFRALGGWVFPLADGAGVPPTARLYGGGNYGMRGFGRHELSSYARACDGDDCDDLPVGGLSTVQGTVELRWLPFRQLYGAAVFADLGSMGDGLNPFEFGTNLALGAGLRIRVFWYFSLALDFSYRVLDDDRFDRLDVGAFQFFGRIGEAF